MILGMLSVQKTGMITLPKKWRDRYPVRHVVAEEISEGLLIKPYSAAEYWEDDKGNFGLRFPSGIQAGKLADRMEHALKLKKNMNKRA